MGILDGKVAVVTGASSGIGEGVTRLFCKEGAKVAFIARRRAKAEKIVEEIKAAGGEVTYVEGDVTKLEDIDRLVETAVEKYGPSPSPSAMPAPARAACCTRTMSTSCSIPLWP